MNKMSESVQYYYFERIGRLLLPVRDRDLCDSRLGDRKRCLHRRIECGCTGCDRKRMERKSGISSAYQSADSGGNTFTCAVPVYSGEQVTGVLTASVSIDSLPEILGDQILFDGWEYMYLISDRGEILARSGNRDTEESLSTIYDESFFEPEDGL